MVVIFINIILGLSHLTPCCDHRNLAAAPTGLSASCLFNLSVTRPHGAATPPEAFALDLSVLFKGTIGGFVPILFLSSQTKCEHHVYITPPPTYLA